MREVFVQVHAGVHSSRLYGSQWTLTRSSHLYRTRYFVCNTLTIELSAHSVTNWTFLEIQPTSETSAMLVV
jgi:hypothetical protein